MSFDAFLRAVVIPTAYPEPLSPGHARIAADMVRHVAAHTDLGPGTTVFDLGCGQGPALAAMQALGWQVTGMALTTDDVTHANAAGLPCLLGDMHTAPLPVAHLYWCRHVLEHSPAPAYVLWRLRQVAPAGAWLFIEVPEPGTPCLHETNPNHFAVHTPGAWQALVPRCGWQVTWTQTVLLGSGLQQDRYFAMLARAVS